MLSKGEKGMAMKMFSKFKKAKEKYKISREE